LGVAIFALWIFGRDTPQVSAPYLPSSVFLIPQKDLAGVMQSANANDLKAIQRLIDHFDRSSGHAAETKFWRERARALGDPTELRLHASELFAQAKYSSIDAREKERVLMAAMDSAKLSQKSEDTQLTRKLIGMIELELGQRGK
jgi:hypothetical protein